MHLCEREREREPCDDSVGLLSFFRDCHEASSYVIVICCVSLSAGWAGTHYGGGPFGSLPYAPPGFNAAYLTSPPPFGAVPGSTSALVAASPLPWPPPPALSPPPGQDLKGSPPAAIVPRASSPADKQAKEVSWQIVLLLSLSLSLSLLL